MTRLIRGCFERICKPFCRAHRTFSKRSQTETQTAVRLKTRALGKRLIVTLPELNDNEEVELIVLRTTPTTEAAPEQEKPKFASALEFLRSLPQRNLTPEQWGKAEREMREERDSWGD